MLLKIEYGYTATIRIILPFNTRVFGLSSIFPKGSIITRILSVCAFLFYKTLKKETKKCYMIQLNEIINGEIISLKKAKNGIVTIKIQKETKKNGVFRNFRRKLVRDSLSGGNDCGNLPDQERQEDSGGETGAQD